MPSARPANLIASLLSPLIRLTLHKNPLVGATPIFTTVSPSFFVGQAAGLLLPALRTLAFQLELKRRCARSSVHNVVSSELRAPRSPAMASQF
jgi:hypothetical protein